MVKYDVWLDELLRTQFKIEPPPDETPVALSLDRRDLLYLYLALYKKFGVLLPIETYQKWRSIRDWVSKQDLV